jgi:hypothetical protein
MADSYAPTSMVSISPTQQILQEHADWPNWYVQLQINSEFYDVWELVNPDARDAPNMMGAQPKAPTLAETTEQETNRALKEQRASPTTEQIQSTLNKALRDHRTLTTNWAEKSKAMRIVWNWVNTTVSKEIMMPAMMALLDTGGGASLQKIIHFLKTEMAPIDSNTADRVRAEYRAHLNAAAHGTMDPQQWITTWNALYRKATAHKLAETTGALATKDFLRALASRLAPDWARSMQIRIIEHETWGLHVPDLPTIARTYSRILEEHEKQAMNNQPGIFATFGARPNAPPKRTSVSTVPTMIAKCPCLSPGSTSSHPKKAIECWRLETAVRGSNSGRPATLSASYRQEILTRLHSAHFRPTKDALTRKGWSIPAASSSAPQGSTASKITYPGMIQAALIDPQLIIKLESLGVYSTSISFDSHPLSKSTIFDNGAATHLVNSVDLLEPGSFVRSPGLQTVEAGTQAFPILGKGKRRFKNILNGNHGEQSEDLVLNDVVVVEGFHVNIISEARLFDKRVWYLGLDSSLRIGTLEESIILARMKRAHNLTFVEYKPLYSYSPNLINAMLPGRPTPKSWTTHPRTDSEELWHKRAGHLGQKALQALVTRARNVRINGTKRIKCSHCATTHAKQVISRRPRERAPRPYYRVAWDLFDMPPGRSGEQWILVLKCSYSGKIHCFNLQGKTLSEIMRVIPRFAQYIETKYNLRIVVLHSDNDSATLPWRGESRYEQWARAHGITIERTPPWTHEPNGGPERAGQEIITKSIKMANSANLPTKLWPDVVEAATWLYNMSPSSAHDMQSPNETLDSWFTQYFRWYEPARVRSALADLRPDWSGIYAYGCRAYPLNRERAAGRDRRGFKVTPRGHIGYLVGYRASNIYRIWIPKLNQVITTRNVTFDEELFYKDAGESQAIVREDAIKLVHILHEEDGEHQAGEATQANGISDELNPESVEHPAEQQLGGGTTDPHQGTNVQSNHDKDQLASTTRAISLADKSHDSRAGRAAPHGLPSPEPTPEPDRQDGTSGAPRGAYDQTPLPREVHTPADMAPADSEPGQHVQPTRSSAGTTASRHAPALSEGASEAATAPARRTQTRRVYEGPVRESRRIRGEAPEKGRAGAGKGGQHFVSREQESIRLYDPDDPQFLLFIRINFPTAKALAKSEHATVHAVIAAALAGQFKEPPRGAPRTHRDTLPALPNKWKDLYTHLYGALFREAAWKEIQKLMESDTWTEINRTDADQKPLPLKWVFTYKFDQDGYFLKCKARICVRGDLQSKDSIESTYATTLAARSFRTMMAIAAEFDLEIRQLDVAGAFLYASREDQPSVLCELPDGFTKPGKCVRLKRALYGLRDSPILWYKEFSGTLRRLGLLSSKEEPCLFFDKERRIVVLFYVDDILVMYHKDDAKKGTEMIAAIKSAYEVDDRGAAEWFLGIRIVRDRKLRTISLVHDSYIEKITAKFNLANTARFPDTPLSTTTLVKSSGSATKQEIKAYQERIGSILYTAIMIRPDIAFAASQLSHFLTNPDASHFAAAEQVILYLFRTKTLSIRYGAHEGEHIRMCGDASFADDVDSRRSTHGYVISLFGGPVIWKSARQPTVTTSTTEAELLALELVSKESMAFKRFLTELMLSLGTGWQIFCDNLQTIRLVVGEHGRVTTRLRHVDIQNMWLRQEHAKGSFEVLYMKTSDMPADGMTKALSAQQFIRFREHLNLHNTDPEK